MCQLQHNDVRLCLHGRSDEGHKAYKLFEEMPQKDFVCDVICSYATLICNESKIVESLNLIPRVSDSGLTAISFLLFPPPPKTLLKGEQRTFWRLVICFFCHEDMFEL